ncbi:nitronate monooxygenase [Paracoccus mutanolyticus]|uniref:nitronate monooxygenase n=1 Tax=Paracoccus mutanolyticus TaxID=1499308 RepID=UPI001CB9B9F6|nr:nitronate monooxygenase [Paracoccus mutanolyticus]
MAQANMLWGQCDCAGFGQGWSASPSFHFGLPSAEAIAALKGAGILLVATATSPAEARAIAGRGHGFGPRGLRLRDGAAPPAAARPPRCGGAEGRVRRRDQRTREIYRPALRPVIEARSTASRPTPTPGVLTAWRPD